MLGRHGQGLAEVFLVQAYRWGIGGGRGLCRPRCCGQSVVALHQQHGALGNRVDLHRRHRQLQCRGQAHAERLVEHRAVQPRDRRLEDVGAGRTKQRQADAAIVGDDHRQLVLCTGQRQAQALLAGQHRPLRHVVKQCLPLGRIQPAHGVGLGLRHRALAGLQQGDGAGAFAADAGQQCEVVLPRGLQRLCHQAALLTLGQQAGEEWPRRVVVKGFRAQRE